MYVLDHLEADISLLSARDMGVMLSTPTCPPSQHEPRRLVNSSDGQSGRIYYVLRRINNETQPDNCSSWSSRVRNGHSVKSGTDRGCSLRWLGDDAGNRLLLPSLTLQWIASIARGAKLLVLLCAEGSDSMLALPLSPLPALALALPVRLLIGAFGGGNGLLTPACCST